MENKNVFIKIFGKEAKCSLSNVEILQTIADFMGITKRNSEGLPIVDKGLFWSEVNYLYSLDDMLPVWGKMREADMSINLSVGSSRNYWCDIRCEKTDKELALIAGEKNLIQNVATATALALKAHDEMKIQNEER